MHQATTNIWIEKLLKIITAIGTIPGANIIINLLNDSFNNTCIASGNKLRYTYKIIVVWFPTPDQVYFKHQYWKMQKYQNINILLFLQNYKDDGTTTSKMEPPPPSVNSLPQNSSDSKRP